MSLQFDDYMKHFICIFMLLCSCAVWFSCSDKKGKQSAGAESIPLNLDEEEEVSLFDVFSSVEVIPLETSDSVLLSPNLKRFVVHDTCFYVLSGQDNIIWQFASDGSFVQAINHYGQGPGEYTMLYDFGFNRFTGDLEMLSPVGYLYVYDASGRHFKRSYEMDRRQVPAIHSFVQLTADKYLLFSSSRKGKKMLWYDAQKGEIYSEQYDIPSFVLFSTPYHHNYSPFYIWNDTVHFVQGYNGDVFVADTLGTLSPKYHFDFGKYNFDISDLEEKPVQYYIRHYQAIGSKHATIFATYGENSRYYLCAFAFRKDCFHVLIDKQLHKACCFSSFKEGVYVRPYYMDEEAVYCCLNTSWGLEREPNLEYVLDEAGKAKLKALTEDDNFVVLKFNFKQ